MKVPKFLDKLLEEDAPEEEPEANGRKHNPAINQVPIPNMETPDEENTGRHHKRVKCSAPFRNNMGGGFKDKKLVVLVVVFVAIMVVSLLTMPKKHKKSDAPESVVVSISDAGELGDIAFSVLDTSHGDIYPGDEKGEIIPADGNTFYVINIDAKNVAENAHGLMQEGKFGGHEPSYQFNLVYAVGENRFNYKTTIQKRNKGLLETYEEEIIPLQSINGLLCFEVPDEVAVGSDTLYLSITHSSGKGCLWILRERPTSGEYITEE